MLNKIKYWLSCTDITLAIVGVIVLNKIKYWLGCTAITLAIVGVIVGLFFLQTYRWGGSCV